MTIEQTVLQEIERSKKFHGENNWQGGYFNNFYLRFHPVERELAQKYGSWEVSLEQCFPNNFKDYSRLRRSQSPKQYYETLDAAVAQTNTSLETLKQLAQQIAGNKDEAGFNRLHAQFVELVLPAYIKLREQGYNQQDLTGATCCIGGH